MTSKASPPLQLRIDHFTAQGGRPTQEDRFFFHTFIGFDGTTWGHFIAVLDGHGGASTVDAIISMLPRSMPALSHVLQKGTLGKSTVLTELCETLHQHTRQFVPGSTFTGALIDIRRKIMGVVHLGDSALMLVRDGKAAFATTPHNVRTHIDDREIMVARGGVWDAKDGYVCNGPHGIQCSRTLGDVLIPQIIRTPEVTTCEIKRGDCIMLATDGVVTTSHAERYPDELSQFAALIESDNTLSAEDITYLGMEIRDAHDNATTIIAHLE